MNLISKEIGTGDQILKRLCSENDVRQDQIFLQILKVVLHERFSSKPVHPSQENLGEDFYCCFAKVKLTPTSWSSLTKIQ